MSRSFAETYKLMVRPQDIYFEIYLASRRMAHDLVKLIHRLVVFMPQLTLSLVKAPRLLFASGFNSVPIGTGGFVDVRLKEQFYSLPDWSDIGPWNWSVDPVWGQVQPTQFGARVGPFRFNGARGEARLQHIGTELDDKGAGVLIFRDTEGNERRLSSYGIDSIRGSSTSQILELLGRWKIA